MENDGKVNIEMGDMVGKTYFKVATWFNQDFGSDRERQEALKHVCVEVIQQVLEDTVLQLQGVGGAGVETIKNAPIHTPTSSNGQMFTVKEEDHPIVRAMNENKFKHDDDDN
jgi:hypothetical protein